MLKFHGNEFLKNLQSTNYFSCDFDNILYTFKDNRSDVIAFAVIGEGQIGHLWRNNFLSGNIIMFNAFA